MKDKLLLATTNRGKTNEYRSLLKGIPYELVSLADAGITTVVEETGDTLEENAILKATAFARESGLLSLADDSGLEVDALNGEPGHHAARYAGENATDADKVKFLLSRMKGIPWNKRTARVRTVIAVASPNGQSRTVSGEIRVIIALEPGGDNGFGYDPVLYVPSLGKTMAELPGEAKNAVSHRALAAKQVPGLLKKDPFNIR